MTSNKKNMTGKVSRCTLWATALVVTSGNGAQAVGVTVPMPSAETWKDVRSEMAGSRIPVGISQGLASVLRRLETETDPNLVIRLSYAIARPEELGVLDAFWMKFTVDRGDDAGLTKLLEIRKRAMGAVKVNRQNYLESWLYLAKNGGNYEHCGGGNCGNGVGHGGGNGTGNEGGGWGA